LFRNLQLGLVGAISLAVGAPATAQNFSDSYTFLKSVRERDGAEVERLVTARGATVINTRESSNGEGALHIVTRARDLNWLTYMIRKGAQPDIQMRDGTTPLVIAAQLGWREGAELLLAGRAKVDLPNNRGETPLMFAVQNRDTALVRLLLSKGANPKRTDNATGLSAIDYAKRDNRAAAILKLLEAPPAAPGREIAGPKF
jgi:ankyrin repeat protein